MQLDRISTVVRPRSQWEAADLGMVMARAWWWPLLRAWLVVTLPLFVLLQLLIPGHLWVAMLLLWWLKPLWERALLHILSHALFGEVPTLRQTLRAFPSLAAKQWFASLTYRRFSPSRSMDLPVVQLEGLKGRPRSQRLGVLHGRRGSGAGWLTLCALAVESALPLAMVVLLYIMAPAEAELGWDDLFGVEGGVVELLNNLFWYIGMALVAPFYVAAGFSLYLNRRTWIEGWDIELVFRRLARRAEGGAVAPLALVAALLLGLCQSDPLLAEPQRIDRQQARAAIEAVMAGEQFHEVEEVRHLDWKWNEDEEDESAWEPPRWLLDLVELLASGARLLLWGIAIALLLLFLFRYRHWLAQQAGRLRRGPGAEAAPSPAVLFGMEVGAETLPADVAAEAAALWQQQRHREAYALLYRAALSRLMERHRISLHSAHTEEQCRQRVVAQTPAELGRYFSELMGQWQRLAYGHQRPDDEVTLRLCRDWPRHFEAERHDG